jgi:hypothetical protein
MKLHIQPVAALLPLFLLSLPALAWTPPSNLLISASPYGMPIDVNNMQRTAHAMENASRDPNGKGASKGGSSGGPDAKKKGKEIKEVVKAMNEYEALSNTDGSLEPNYQPPGAPQIPSACMENKQCRPCFEKAQAGLNKSRINLEKVRAHYAYTHRFTDLGKKVITSAGAAGGGIAAVGATQENIEIDEVLANFDKVVRDKNKELLGYLQGNLQELGKCEAEFYKNDDWYNRFGFMYYQFMISQYSY